MKEFRRIPIIHPFLFSFYLIFREYSVNILQVKWQETLRPLLMVFFISASLLIIFTRIFKDRDKAGLFTTLVLFIFLFYGYSYKFPQTYTLFGFHITKHIFIFIFWIVFLILVGNKYVWSRVRPAIVTRYLNITSVISMILPLLTIVSYILDTQRSSTTDLLSTKESFQGIHLQALKKPDIYYIILDGYARKDVLQAIYGFDNQQFIESLSQRNFYIASQSQSNYTQTLPSLASSLNLDYINFLANNYSTTANRDPLIYLVEKSRLFESLKKSGYTLIAFPTGYEPTTIYHADIFLSLNKPYLSSFERFFISLTAYQAFVDNKITTDPGYGFHREIISSMIENLHKVPLIDGPKITFTHIVAPHPPFVFNLQGEAIQQNYPYTLADGNHNYLQTDEYKKLYIDQLIYINNIILETIDYILEESSSPPIIIIQSDHGPGAYLDQTSADNSCLKERTSILNAYFFPDGDYDELYNSISPVNSFRVIYNTYFGTDLVYLADRNYYSTWNEPYKFIDITERSGKKCIYEERP